MLLTGHAGEMAEHAGKIASKTAEEAKVAIGTKASEAGEWLATDPLRRYLAESWGVPLPHRLALQER